MQPLVSNPESLIGYRFGLLTVASVGAYRHGRPGALLACACGAPVVASWKDLVHGKYYSCGCAKVERFRQLGLANATHGQTHTRLYSIWTGMRMRCYYERHVHYKLYGGRGITVCDDWLRFESFAADMGTPPSDEHTLDRIDVDGHYEPSNCRWANREQQANNKTNSRLLTLNGRTQTTAQWARELGVQSQTIRRRLHYGFSVERALSSTMYRPKVRRARR